MAYIGRYREREESGKSLVASILAQCFRGRGRSIQCIATDPANRTFAQYSGIDATRLELMRDGSIDVRASTSDGAPSHEEGT
jgi:hypothetical protein